MEIKDGDEVLVFSESDRLIKKVLISAVYKGSILNLNFEGRSFHDPRDYDFYTKANILGFTDDFRC